MADRANEAGRKAAADLAVATRSDLASAVKEATLHAELRCDALERRARIREAALKQAVADAEFKGRLNSEQHASRAHSMQLRVAKMALIIRQAGMADMRGLPALLEPLLEDGAPIPVSTQTAQAAVAWLATHAEQPMRSDVSEHFEIAASREWGDEAFISAAYLWLLGRDADDNGLHHYSRMLRTGMLHVEVLQHLARSEEALTKLQEGAYVLADGNADFVRSAYRVLIGRNADQLGFDHYVGRLDAQATRASVILDIAQSVDAKTSGTPVSSAIRSIWFANRLPRRILRSLGRYRLGAQAAHQRLWTATRFATLESRIANSLIESRQSLEALANLAEQRVAASREVVLASLPVFSHRTPEAEPVSIDHGRTGDSAGSVAGHGYGEAKGANSLGTSTSNCLIDTSHRRYPAQIVALIRDELMYLGAN